MYFVLVKFHIKTRDQCPLGSVVERITSILRYDKVVSSILTVGNSFSPSGLVMMCNRLFLVLNQVLCVGHSTLVS